MSRLTEIAEAELKSLALDGITCTPEEICWLNDLGRLVEEPQLRVNLRAGCPVLCVDTWFWPFTLQSGQWYTRHACRLFKDPEFLTWSLAFALALGRDEHLPACCGDLQMGRQLPALTFSHLTDHTIARHAVNAWAIRQRFTLAQAREAILVLMPEIDQPWPPRSQPQAKESVDIIAELSAGSGLPPEYWARQLTPVSLGILKSMYRQRCAAGGMAPSEMDDSYRRAMWDFQSASEAIRKSRQPERAEVRNLKPEIQTSEPPSSGLRSHPSSFPGVPHGQ